MQFAPGVSRDAFGGIVIRSKVDSPSATRKGYEDNYYPGAELGLPDWDRAHSQGRITGNESPEAIRYTTREVNRVYQKHVENFIKRLFQEKPKDVDLWLTTVTYTHRRSLRLKEIQYRIDAVHRNRSQTLFEASIMVVDQKTNPRVTIDAHERVPQTEWFSF
jgi:hypothetical protein